MRQPMMADVHLDAGRAARLNISPQPTGGFDRIYAPMELPLPKPPKGTNLASKPP
jgi:hypothetical protein